MRLFEVSTPTLGCLRNFGMIGKSTAFVDLCKRATAIPAFNRARRIDAKEAAKAQMPASIAMGPTRTMLAMAGWLSLALTACVVAHAAAGPALPEGTDIRPENKRPPNGIELPNTKRVDPKFYIGEWRGADFRRSFGAGPFIAVEFLSISPAPVTGLRADGTERFNVTATLRVIGPAPDDIAQRETISLSTTGFMRHADWVLQIPFYYRPTFRARLCAFQINVGAVFGRSGVVRFDYSFLTSRTYTCSGTPFDAIVQSDGTITKVR
jgi:hypothetical protein